MCGRIDADVSKTHAKTTLISRRLICFQVRLNSRSSHQKVHRNSVKITVDFFCLRTVEKRMDPELDNRDKPELVFFLIIYFDKWKMPKTILRTLRLSTAPHGCKT